ncbi:major facilitator superfamily transport protein [Natronomonas pharaonis DSM 2160]|uniref:Major facilitator superfamily transport protein n=1 Tax=Natronomonas pharaonis (strain ATCC 35678 / DSM 2160 / CIP 103997 / JCM 8858 / NBRC 14720 / NCIMB 2260 / Gabara) TaxID=348780 RepID=A0A1U7EWD5_NATPD|nr:MFS transporter [Natronomonas pharaonis]CAI49399.1 major facilitator superfamily transport protein [Natronomonas pharaonis DSM 2160]
MTPDYRHTLLFSCTVAFFATVTARLVISPVVPDIVDAFSTSNSAVGLALTGMWAAYALTQFPSGILGDRFGERRVILFAVVGTAVCSGLLALSPTFWLFALLALCLGVAAGLHYIVATALLTRNFERTGRAIGFHVTGAPLAGLLAPAAAALVATWYGWRAAVLVGAAVAVPAAALFAATVRPEPPQFPDRRMRDRVELGSIVRLYRRGPILYATVLSVLGAFTWQATASFLPAFLEAHHGLSRAVAGGLFSVYFFIHGALQPLMGSLSDRFSRDAIAAVTMGLGVVGYGSVVVGDSFSLVVAATVCVGVAMTWGAPLQSKFIDVLGEQERGAGFGLVRTVYMLLGALGSVAIGVVADLFGWPVAFGSLAGIMALGLLCILWNNVFGAGY